jgi:DNA-binding CsgD family transcriptional regulator
MDDLKNENDIFEDEEYLYHYGTPRHSGRYPWGSGKNPQRSKDFLSRVRDMKKAGSSEAEIAKNLGLKNTSELRAKITIANNAATKSDMYLANRLKAKGYSNVAIGKRMGINESTVRSLLNPSRQARAQVLDATSDILKEKLDKYDYVDVGLGTEKSLNVSQTKLNNAIAILEQQGYATYNIKISQLGTTEKTTVKVLAPEGTSYKDIYNNLDKIHTITDSYVDTDSSGNPKIKKIHEPKSISSDRVAICYNEEGGLAKDGVVEIRRGVEDLDLGNARYAQVRIAVDGTHYIKGMAMYADDLPDGVDLRFNTNKHVGTDKMDVLKKIDRTAHPDPLDPFGAVINRQNDYVDKDGKEQQGALNIVREEGEWDTWSNSLSSQMLSKQSTTLAKKQLNLDYTSRQDEFNEIASITQPVVKQKLLESFAENCDSAAVHLSAAALPRQGYRVILPIDTISENEIYAPTFKDGEKVVLIRYPHGGIFEIPELTVNNRNEKADSLIHNAADAVGINSKVAEQLSGADFDGDTVLVIPNNSKSIKTKSPLSQLKDFDPKEAYGVAKDDPAYETVTKGFSKGLQMGSISNLITDMTLHDATDDELARAVRHSMVVIDTEKHHLDWRASENDNNIQQLRDKYQSKADGGKGGGASTLISKASSEERVPHRKTYSGKRGINPETGEKIYETTGETYTVWDRNTGKTVTKARTTSSTKMAETKDAYTLSSGTVMESIYADYANKCKALANTARKEYYAVSTEKANPSAKETYSKEIASLNAKLNTAEKNKPLERKAQILGNIKYKTVKDANPGMSYEESKKEKGKALQSARRQVGALKEKIKITDKEWEAIQANAISPTKLKKILDNADMDVVRDLATPKNKIALSDSKKALIRAYANSGHTLEEIAEALGISTSTVSGVLNA